MRYRVSVVVSFLALIFLGISAGAGEVDVDVKLTPAGSFKAQTNKVNGVAYKTPDGVMAKNVVIDLKSLGTGIALRDKHMKQRLLVEKYPEAKLIKAVGKDGKGKATIEIKGHRQEVDGTYVVENNTLKAQFKIHLPELDIKDVRYMGIGVSDDVIVNVSLPIKEGSPQRIPASKRKARK